MKTAHHRGKGCHFPFEETWHTVFFAHQRGGPNCCGGFCKYVAGLFKESDSLFRDGELFSSADTSLFMVHKPPEVRYSKCAKNSNIIQPMGFKDWRTHQMMSSKYANMAEIPRSARASHNRATLSITYTAPYAVYDNTT